MFAGRLFSNIFGHSYRRLRWSMYSVIRHWLAYSYKVSWLACSVRCACVLASNKRIPDSDSPCDSFCSFVTHTHIDQRMFLFWMKKKQQLFHNHHFCWKILAKISMSWNLKIGALLMRMNTHLDVHLLFFLIRVMLFIWKRALKLCVHWSGGAHFVYTINWDYSNLKFAHTMLCFLFVVSFFCFFPQFWWML